MAFNFQYNPYSAISGALRVIGNAQFLRDEEERRRKRELEERKFAQDSQKLIDDQHRRAFDQGLAIEQLNEGKRRFDVGLQSDQYNQQMDRGDRQSQLAAQLQSRRQSEIADLQGRQFSAGAERQLLQDRLGAGLQERQMQGEQEMLRQAALGQRQQELGALQADAQLRNKFLTSEPDPFIVQGLQSGALRYSDRQKADMQKYQDSINEARRDPKLTPAERMQFEAQQAEAYRQVRDNPQEVPPDERPVPLDQQFQQETTEIAGLPGRWQRSMRNGVPQWEAVELPEDPQVEVARKQQEMELKQREADFNEERERNREQREIMRERWKTRNEDLKMRRDAELEGLAWDEPDESQFTSGKDENQKPIVDSAKLRAAQVEHQKKRQAIIDRYGRQLEIPPNLPPQFADPLPASMPATPGQNGQAVVGAEAEQQPVAQAQTPDELRSLIVSGSLNIGDTVMTPRGPKPLTPEVYQKLMGGM